MSVTIHKGSILDLKVDAIVNPANSFLRHSGGLAAVIARAATAPFDPFPLEQWATPHGERPTPIEKMRVACSEHDQRIARWQREHANAPLIATGNVYATSAGVLPFQAVIHAVGPIWDGGRFLEIDLLEQVHCSILDLCVERDFRSVALPAISCGVFGFPVDAAAPIATDVAAWYGDRLDITFALFEDAHYLAYQEALRA